MPCLDKELKLLEDLGRFDGAGIYAIYYRGSFPAYVNISLSNQENKETPIYVGKAVPPGARKGNFGLDAPPGQVLFKRLMEHAKSISQANNLRVDDFVCRYLVVEDIWIPLGESLLINWFNPLWNKVLDGFGNHDPGSGRYNQQKSYWDTLHPGRPWAERLEPCTKALQEIEALVAIHLSIGEDNNGS